MKHCIVCSIELNNDNHAIYRKRNYINKCNNCSNHEKKIQGRNRGKAENNSRSKICRDNLKKNDPVRYTCIQLSNNASGRAKKFNMGFDVNAAFLISIAPERCPVFDAVLMYGGGIKGKYAASIDRIDSSKGYTKDNVQIISYLANLMKSNATQSEMNKFADWIKKGTHKDSLK